MTSILNQQIQNGIVLPTGQPYYIEHLERNQLKIYYLIETNMDGMIVVVIIL